MNRFGKSFKNRFLAMALAGVMVMSGMTSSGMLVYATESADAEVAEDAKTWSETDDDSEEAAEEEEVKQTTSEETETKEQNNKESYAESEAGTKKESTTAAAKVEDDKEVEETDSDDSDSDDSEEQQTDSVDNKATVIYTSDSAALADGHTYAKWGLNETAINDDDTSATSFEGKKGIYKNTNGDILYIDASTSAYTNPAADASTKGKFAPGSSYIQVRPGTKIYVPVKVENNEAKIILYQKYISSQDEVIYEEGMTAERSFKLSGDGFTSVQCTLGEKDGSFYRTELICSLTGNKESAVICIEIKGDSDQHLSQIISGKEVRDDVYDDDYGNSKDLVKYNMEGFANAYGVTGGGIMKNTAANYYKVGDAAAFLDALSKIKKAKEPAVIEVTGDLNLGSKELGIESESFDEDYKSFIGADAYQALWHPTLKTSGVSDLTLDGFSNLTIFSSNDKGSAIKHCNIVIKNSTNIIFRNFYFDELWEWDDGGTVEKENATYEQGGYKRNDWDYLCIDNSSDGIWIDHCTFYKAYDGVVDIKNPKTNGKQHVTISWCKFEPKSAPDENGDHPFYDAQIEAMEADIKSAEPKSVYYRKLRAATTEKVTYKYIEYIYNDDGSVKSQTNKETQLSGEGYAVEDIITYTCGQKKTHLLGQGDTATNAVGIRATFANNSWVNCMDRLPRLRFGVAHEYNCVLDASELYTARITNSKAKSHLVSNGAISTMGGYVFLENCYIDGIVLPLNSGNGTSKMGYIGQTGSIYKLNGEDSKLEIVNNSNSGSPDYQKAPLILTKAKFEEQLPDNYGSYQLYEAADLKTDVIPYAGAGSVKMTAVQWTKTSYGKRDVTIDPNPDEPESSEVPKDEESSDAQNSSENDNIEEKSSAPASTEGESAQASSSTEAESAQSSSSTEAESAQSSSSTEAESIQASSSTEAESTQSSSTTEESSISEESSNIEESSVEDASVPLIEFSLSADEIEQSSLTSDYTKNGFTIKVKSGTTITIDSSNKGGYTKRIKLGGTGTADNRSIHFTAEDAGKLTVYAVSSSSSESKILTLYQYNGSQSTEVSSRTIETGSTLQELSYEITEPGDYYVGGNGGVNVYCIKFSNKKEESGENDAYDPMEVDAEWSTFSAPEGDIVYGADEGTNNTLTKYNQEGYAQAAKVTGGGLLKEEDPGYYKVTNELEFIQAISDIFRVNDKPHVIEITTDLNLGNLELNEKYKDDKLNVTTSGDGYQKLFRAQTAYPLMHPILKETGVSYIKLHDIHNLTIFSKNGAMIKHAEMNIEGGSSNIIIRNLTFDELWEWDEGDAKNKPGDYDRNDWDYVTVDDNADGVWIDHCTFYKAYDGIVDVKNPGLKDMKLDYERVTISWCEILPGSKDNTFFDAQMTWLEEQLVANSDKIPYYTQLRQKENMSAKDVWWSSYGQKKVHLFGAGDSDTQDKAIRVTLANNYYKDTMSRLPRLRFGKVHEYNCVFDAQELHDQHKSGNPHITGNGAISTCKGEMLIENCYISGVRTPLRSGYGGVSGYIKAVDTLYYMDGQPKELEIKAEGTDGLKVTDEVRFRERLPYSDYVKYDASKLNDLVLPYAGAGKLDMTTVQWERTNYNGEGGGNNDNKPKDSIYIVGLEPSYAYTGVKIIPDIEVWDYDIPGGKLLAPGTDYTVAYKNNVNPGTNKAEVTVTGKGNYAGKDVSQKFSIVETVDVKENLADLKGAKIDKINDVEFNGKAQYPDFVLTQKGGSPVTYTQNTDPNVEGLYKRTDNGTMNVNIAVSNNINKGTATILVTGAADAKGKPTSIKKTFKITAIDLTAKADKVTVDKPADVEYAVSGAVPASITVKYDGTTLKQGKDYTVKYANNKKIGKGNITITGKGNYAKKYPTLVEYTINPLDLSGLEVNAVTACEDAKAGKVKATVVDKNGTALKASQYTVKVYKAAEGEGDAVYDATEPLTKEATIYVSVEAKDTNLKEESATPRAAFKVGKDISKAKFTVKKTAVKSYTGEAVTLSNDDLEVTLKGESNLEMGTDYEVAAYTNNINKGTATAVIRGINKYSGTKTVKFKITQKTMTVSGVKTWSDFSTRIRETMNSLSKK